MGLLIQMEQGGLYVDSDVVAAVEREGDVVHVDAEIGGEGRSYSFGCGGVPEAATVVDHLAATINSVRLSDSLDEVEGDEGGTLEIAEGGGL